jgi:hypothetical protein
MELNIISFPFFVLLVGTLLPQKRFKVRHQKIKIGAKKGEIMT